MNSFNFFPDELFLESQFTQLAVNHGMCLTFTWFWPQWKATFPLTETQFTEDL